MDNATAHVHHTFRDYLQKTGIETLGFGGSPINDEGGVPPNSPDMNAIERLFGEWGDKVNARNPQNVSELIRIAKDDWDKFTPEHIRKYIYIYDMYKVYAWIKENQGLFYKKS